MTTAQDGPPPAQTQIGPYTVLREIGQGGMGRVYLARSPGGRLVAVKSMREELLLDPGFRERFRAEAAAARRVAGAFTAPVIDSDADAPVPWLATAYVDGPSLADMVAERGPLPTEFVRRLAAGLAEALASVHAAGVVHRDLKPSNILMADDGPRLIDFGIARAVEGPSAFRPGRRPIGSAGYISPERWVGQAATGAADMFSFGAVLCFAATGTGPFGSGHAELVDARAAQLAPQLDDIPDPLIRAIARHCLARDAGARPGPRDVLAMLEGSPFVPGRGATRTAQAQRRRRLIFAVSGGAAAAAAIAAALALASPGGGSAGAGSGFAWSVPERSAQALVGVWGGAHDVVLGDSTNGLTGYDAATGQVAWTWKPPSGDSLCGMSQGTYNGLGAFDYGPASNVMSESCGQLQTIAVDSGKVGWAKPLSLSYTSGAAPDQSGTKALSIGEGLVSAPYYAAADAADLGSSTDLLAASVTTGTAEWTTDDGLNQQPDGCVLTGLAQVLDGSVYTLGDCGGDHHLELLELGPNGHGTANLVGTVGDCSMASASALAGFLVADSDYMLIGCQGESANGGLYALKAGSSVLVPLSTPLAADLTPSAGGGESVPGGVLLDGNTLYLASSGGTSSSGPSSTPSVVALDLDSGKTLWSHQFPGATDVAPLTANPSGMLVAVVNSTAGTAAVQALSHAEGSVTATQALNPSEEAPFNALNTNVEAPYAVAVGSYVSVAFPSAAEPGQTLLGTMTAP